jgi:transcriptional regulator with XRE-family HTH domain
MASVDCPHCKGTGKIRMPDKLGERLAFLRGQRSMSLREVEAALNGVCSHTNLHHIEIGKNASPSIHTVAALAKIYGVSLDALMAVPEAAIHS